MKIHCWIKYVLRYVLDATAAGFKYPWVILMSLVSHFSLVSGIIHTQQVVDVCSNIFDCT